MMADEQLKACDAGRDIGAELLQSVREMTVGRWARKIKFKPMADGSIRRTVVCADGTLEKQEVLATQQTLNVPARDSAYGAETQSSNQCP